MFKKQLSQLDHAFTTHVALAAFNHGPDCPVSGHQNDTLNYYKYVVKTGHLTRGVREYLYWQNIRKNKKIYTNDF